MSGAKILALVEDPGAANLIVGLDEALAERGFSFELWACGTARPYLHDRGVPFFDAGDGPPRVDATALRLVAVGTSESPAASAFALIAAAQRRGVRTVGLVDSPASAAARFRGTSSEPLTHLPDELIVADQQTADAFANLGVARELITIAVNPALLAARRRGARLRSGDWAELRSERFGGSAEPIIVFLSELSDGLDAAAYRRSVGYTLEGRGSSDERTDIVIETLLDAASTLTPKPRVVVRLHPKEPADAHAAYRDELHAFDCGGDPLELCAAADLVVGMTTTLLAEVHQMGQRVLAILPRPAERAWLADLASGAIASVCQPDAVAPEIVRALAAPRRQPPPPAGAVLADVLADLARRKRPARVMCAG